MGASDRLRWTIDRQHRFLDSLAQTGTIACAAAAGMSRESAYRLRNRADGALFAALWDRCLELRPSESHTIALRDGDFAGVGSHVAKTTRTRPL